VPRFPFRLGMACGLAPRRVSRALGAALLAAALLAPAPAAANPPEAPGALGVLWLPDAAPARGPLVIVLHDASGIDPRGWLHGEQIMAAGVPVLHVELADTAMDGTGPAPGGMGGDGAEATARLGRVVASVAGDARFASQPIGILAFGGTARAAMLVAADPAVGARIAALVLFYPGCAVLDAALPPGRGPGAAILLKHGDADPANLPADCAALAATRTASFLAAVLGGRRH
jgi:dienelactone hydrolase